MILLLALAQLAFAGQVFINGIEVHPAQIAGTTMQKVDVTFDQAGNIRVTAPGYKIEVQQPVAPAAHVPQAAGHVPPQPAAAPPVPTHPIAAAATAPAQPPAPAPGMHPSGVPKAQWWLVVEDNGSIGHAVEVFVNGQLVQTVRSGEPMRIPIDVGGALRPGDNQVVVKSNSVGAGGGALYVYIGTGGDRSGTFVLDQPQVQYGLGKSRSGPYQREYSFQVK